MPTALSTKRILKCSLVLSILFLSVSARGQFGALNDINNLTEQEINSLIIQFENSGMSISEVETLARTQGVSESEIQKVRASYEARNSNSSNKADVVSSSGGTRSVIPVAQSQSRPTVNNNATSNLEIFGMDLFKPGGNQFNPRLDIPTPKEYILGVGDELMLDFWGSTQKVFNLRVSDEGTVRPESTRPIYISGLTIDEAKERIVNRMSSFHAGLKSKNGEEPSISYELSLTRIRTIDVQIVGDVKSPGTYSLPSLATVYRGLELAGGPTSLGTMRGILLMRNGRRVSSIDLYGYLTQGIKTGDMRLQSGDVILVPRKKVSVRIEGRVRRPAIYELNKDEKLMDLFNYAEGFTSDAYKSKVTLKRFGDTMREIIDVESSRFESFEIRDGDQITIGGILQKFANKVTIKGAVERFGEYELKPEMTLGQLLNEAIFKGDASISNIRIYRVNEDYRQEVIGLGFENADEAVQSQVSLSPDDIISIPSIHEMEEEFYVSVHGEVQDPGIYPYFEKMTLEDLIVLSHGSTRLAHESLEIIRESNDDQDIPHIIIGNLLESRNINLQAFDRIYIRSESSKRLRGDVTIEGEVQFPGTYDLIRQDETIKDIVKRAGGVTDYADLNGAILIRNTRANPEPKSQIIDRSQLNDLRSKIKEGSSHMKTEIEAELLDRIGRLEVLAKSNDFQDDRGQALKYNLLTGTPLNENGELVGVSGREPVAINLQKILDEDSDEANLSVTPGDVISIPERQETVRVAGEVVSSIILPYESKKKCKDYISLAGGYLSTSKKNRSYIQYANGERRKFKSFLFFKNYPPVKPGATIVISKKEEKPPVNYQSVIASASAMASLVLVLDRLLN